MLPPHAERAMRYSAATFGAYFLAGLAVPRRAPIDVIASRCIGESARSSGRRARTE